MESPELKNTARIRKFSWTKTHSVQEESNKLELKRSGSMNNIVLGWKTEAERHTDKKRNRKRSNTMRQKKKNSKSKGNAVVDSESPLKGACVNMANLGILAPLVPAIPLDTRVSGLPWVSEWVSEGVKSELVWDEKGE